MRVSSGNIYSALNRALTDANARAQRAALQVGTGEAIQHASDSPVDASQLMRLDSELSQAESYQRSITDTNAWMATADAALNDVISVLQRANDLALSAMNGSLSAGERAAISEELRQLRAQIASSANASYLGQAVFAGFSSSAVDPATYAFTGTVGDVARKIDASTVVSASFDGKEMLGFNAAPGKDVFSVLSDLADQVDAGSMPGIAAARADLDDRFEGVAYMYEVVGTRTQAVERIAARLDRTTQETSAARAAIGEVDLAKALLDLSSAQSSYQAALQAVAKATMPTLADYL